MVAKVEHFIQNISMWIKKMDSKWNTLYSNKCHVLLLEQFLFIPTFFIDRFSCNMSSTYTNSPGDLWARVSFCPNKVTLGSNKRTWIDGQICVMLTLLVLIWSESKPLWIGLTDTRFQCFESKMHTLPYLITNVIFNV